MSTIDEILEEKLSPADTCIFCGKRLDEIGGKRIVAQNSRGIILAKKPWHGRKSFKLSDDKEVYLVVWGGKHEWTASMMEKAKETYAQGKRPWYCQICGGHTCSECGSPRKLPMGADILDEDGISRHVPILPCDLGCINPKCKKYRKPCEEAKARQ